MTTTTMPGKFPFRLEIIRSARRRRAAFRLPADGGVQVLIPAFMSDAALEFLLERFRPRLERMLSAAPPAYELTEGAMLPLDGGNFPLRFTAALLMFDNAFLVPRGPAAEIKNNLERLYRAEAARRLLPRAKKIAAESGYKAAGFRIGGARSSWGCCSGGKRITFSWRTVLLPPDLSEYVIRHELAHTAEMNHSPVFWREVEAHCPDYRERARRLKSFRLPF